MLPRLQATHFSKPESVLAETDPATIGAIIATASDVALVVDAGGMLQDFAIGAEGLDGAEFADWLGTPIEELVSPDSRGKLAELIDAASSTTGCRGARGTFPSATARCAPTSAGR